MTRHYFRVHGPAVEPLRARGGTGAISCPISSRAGTSHEPVLAGRRLRATARRLPPSKRTTSHIRCESPVSSRQRLSRWLWLVKWLLAIPHFVVLLFLWIAFFVLTVVAFFAILFTGRYPRAIFDFNVGVLRWTWRVGFYSYSALGTDAYPPFTLADVTRLSGTARGRLPAVALARLVLVKWWLLALPHYLVIGVFTGGALGRPRRGRAANWSDAQRPGRPAGPVRRHRAAVHRPLPEVGLYDFVLGINRWVFRVVAYAALMTDAYPPLVDTGEFDGPTEPCRSTPAGEPSGAPAPRRGRWIAPAAAMPPVSDLQRRTSPRPRRRCPCPPRRSRSPRRARRPSTRCFTPTATTFDRRIERVGFKGSASATFSASGSATFWARLDSDVAQLSFSVAGSSCVCDSRQRALPFRTSRSSVRMRTWLGNRGDPHLLWLRCADLAESRRDGRSFLYLAYPARRRLVDAHLSAVGTR